MSSSQSIVARLSHALNDGDRIGIIRAVKQLIEARAGLTSGWKSLTTPLIDFGELDLACRAIDLYAQALGGSPSAQFERALIYTRCARSAEALAILEGIGWSVPDEGSNAYLRGTIALNLGERDIAREALLRASRARPFAGQIFQTLSMLASMKDEPAIAEHILSAEKVMREALPAEQAGYLYALGKTLDDIGETDRAFAAFAAGSALIAVERPYDPISDTVLADIALDGWTLAAIEKIGGRITVPTDRPIIVTGLPRSGSTLVEQILVSHSGVSDGDELGRFTLLVNEIGGPSVDSIERWLETHDPNTASRHYIHLLNQRFGKTGRVVDKTLEASRYLGVMAALMPDAPILWMQRKPLDNAWSCFSTWFLSGLAWSWSLPEMAHHFALEDMLLARWRDILGDRLHVVSYEALASEKEIEIPHIMSYVGLSVEPGVFSPEKTERLVTTASLSQVRAPINTRAIGRSERYRPHLQPFVDAYADHGGSVD